MLQHAPSSRLAGPARCLRSSGALIALRTQRAGHRRSTLAPVRFRARQRRRGRQPGRQMPQRADRGRLQDGPLPVLAVSLARSAVTRVGSGTSPSGHALRCRSSTRARREQRTLQQFALRLGWSRRPPRLPVGSGVSSRSRASRCGRASRQISVLYGVRPRSCPTPGANRTLARAPPGRSASHKAPHLRDATGVVTKIQSQSPEMGRDGAR